MIGATISGYLFGEIVNEAVRRLDNPNKKEITHKLKEMEEADSEEEKYEKFVELMGEANNHNGLFDMLNSNIKTVFEQKREQDDVEFDVDSEQIDAQMTEIKRKVEA